MHEDKFWESFAKGAEVWSLVVVILVVSLIVFLVLRLATGAVADRRTRRILNQGLSDDDDAGASPKDDPDAKKP